MLLRLLIAVVVAHPQAPAGIVGGKPANKGDLPWITNRYLRCGGSLIHPSWVLTAAHCTYVVGDSIDYNRWNLSAPEAGSQGTVAVHIRHPLFDLSDPTGEYDIALLRFAQPSKDISPAKLVNSSQESLMYSGALFSVAGWGSVKEGKAQSAVLQIAQIPIIANNKCSDSQHYGLIQRIFASQICAGLDEGGKDACAGDSGSPMFRMINNQPVIFGVVSWGVGCGRPLRPGVYTRVSTYRSWIIDQLKQYGDELSVVSCGGHCGGQVDSCACDELCSQRDDCCNDYDKICAAPGVAAATPVHTTPSVHIATLAPNPPADCTGHCEDNKAPLKYGFSYCWCDSECLVNGDCCDSFRKVCVQQSIFSQFFHQPSRTSTPSSRPTATPSSSAVPVTSASLITSAGLLSSSPFASFFIPAPSSASSSSSPISSVSVSSSWSSLPASLLSFFVPYFSPSSLAPTISLQVSSSSQLTNTSLPSTNSVLSSVSPLVKSALPNTSFILEPKIKSMWIDYDYDSEPKTMKFTSRPAAVENSLVLPKQQEVIVNSKLTESSRLPQQLSSPLSLHAVRSEWRSSHPSLSPTKAPSTALDPQTRSCLGWCQGQNPGGCWCDSACVDTMDCCSDVALCSFG